METKSTLYLIYDGDCPICSYCSKVIRIRANVGKLEIINARTSHPLVEEIKLKGFDLNEGFALKFNENYYHGVDALHFIAMVGSSSTLLSRFGVWVFRSPLMAKIFYPPLKAIRSLLLTILHIPKIPKTTTNNQPIFASVFGSKWPELPPVMKAHYANYPFTNDVVKVKGRMTIATFGMGKILFPLFSLFRVWVPYTGKDIPIEVYFRSYPDSPDLHFERIYQLPNRKPYHFRSRMIQINNNEIVELMPFNIGWNFKYQYDNGKVFLNHKRYVFKFFKWYIPFPIGLLIGKTNAVEESTSDTTFSMKTEMIHPWFGKIYEYGGEFTLVE